MDPTPPPRPPMVGWYDPPRLISIAIRVAISTVFGEFADRRESWLTTRGIDPTGLEAAFDYGEDAEDGAFWFDYVADSGDGWNPTYAMARLLAEPQLEPVGSAGPLPQGRILVMGGDQVYPAASREEYQAKLVAPYDEAARDKSWREAPPDLYAIPGNHDWYDGLAAFLNLFCRRRREDPWTRPREGRKIGGRQTQQTRSYFALKLPNGWWLWGADIQLRGYIDQPQIDFFRHVAERWMEPNSQLILCTGQPSWTYVNTDLPGSQFRNFSYIERVAQLARGKNHAVRVVVSGDTHHYARYTEGGRHYITSGGGGAFLHPTHQLVDKVFKYDFPPPNVEPDPDPEEDSSFVQEFRIAKIGGTDRPSLFPDRATSIKLSWGNLAFAALNRQYTASMMLLLTLFSWLMDSQATSIGSSLLRMLVPHLELPFGEIVLNYLALVFTSPWGVGFALLFLVGYVYLADFRGGWRKLAGSLHAAAQIALVMLSTCGLAVWLQDAPGDCAMLIGGERCLLPLSANAKLIIASGVVGGIVSATILGLYLVVCLNLFGVHWNEAFSSLRIQGYKNFLRFRIGPDGALTIYPIGLAKVPWDRGRVATNPPLAPHLIEGPIVLAPGPRISTAPAHPA